MVDVRKREQCLELTFQARGHRVERRGELAEFVTGRDRHPRRKILVPGAPGAFDQFLQRPQSAPNLRDAQQCRNQQSEPCHWNECRIERRNRCEDVGLEPGGNDGPATNAETGAKEQLAIVGKVRFVFERRTIDVRRTTNPRFR